MYSTDIRFRYASCFLSTPFRFMLAAPCVCARLFEERTLYNIAFSLLIFELSTYFQISSEYWILFELQKLVIKFSVMMLVRSTPSFDSICITFKGIFFVSYTYNQYKLLLPHITCILSMLRMGLLLSLCNDCILISIRLRKSWIWCCPCVNGPFVSNYAVGSNLWSIIFYRNQLTSTNAFEGSFDSIS